MRTFLGFAMVALVLGDRFARTLFAKDVRHKAMYGGRGSGKTWSIGSYLVYIANTQRKRIICARQFQNSIRDSSKDLIERRIRDFELDQNFSLTEPQDRLGVFVHRAGAKH